ncbi:MAG: DUF3108 domain-containing protein [Sedimenticola sp.]
MNATRQRISPLIAGLMLLLSTPLSASPDMVLTPFSAEYSLNRNDTILGKVLITLELTPGGDYRYRAYTVTTGLISLFRDDQITEQSQGVVKNGSVRPDNYLYHHRRSNNPREVTVDFNWRTGRVTNHTGENRWSMRVPPGTQDKFSTQLALMMAVGRGERDITFKVADGGMLKNFHFSTNGSERVTTGNGSVNSIRVERVKEDRPSDSTLWLSPELNYLPVKISKQKRDEQVIMLLRSVTWN